LRVANMQISMKKMPISRDGGSAFIRPTALERSMGRLLRGPDGHDPAADPAPAPADPAAPPADPADPTPADPNAGTALGAGDPPADPPSPPADPDPALAVPEKYEFTPVDGVDIDQAAVELATPVLKDLGLSNEQANKLVPVLQGVIANRDQQMIDSIATERAKWLTEAKADPEIGGKAFGDNLALAATALDRLGFVKDSPFRKLLDESGLGNHPEMIRAWSKVGKAIGEDSDFIRTTNPSVKKSDDAILYPNMKTGE